MHTSVRVSGPARIGSQGGTSLRSEEKAGAKRVSGSQSLQGRYRLHLHRRRQYRTDCSANQLYCVKMSRGNVLGCVFVAFLATTSSGCRSSLDTFNCSRDSDCLQGEEEGVCEASSLCSFTDSSCVSGRRFGKLGGESSNQCVLEDAGVADASPLEPRADAMPSAIDAMPSEADAMPDAMLGADAMPLAGDAAPVSDGGISCPVSATANTCPTETCPNTAGQLCCVYQVNADEIDCNEVCTNSGSSCSSAAEGDGACLAGNSRSCGNKNIDNICYCN